MNVSRAIVRQFAVRQYATKSDVHPGYAKIKQIQEAFQKKDGKPVFLKGGAGDQVLYRVTMGLCFVGIGGMLKLFWDLSVPKST